MNLIHLANKLQHPENLNSWEYFSGLADNEVITIIKNNKVVGCYNFDLEEDCSNGTYYKPKDFLNKIFNKFGDGCLVLIMKFDEDGDVCKYSSYILKQASVILVED